MHMKKRNRSLSIFAFAAAMLGMGQVQAIGTPSGADATDIRVSPSGVGHMLVVPYYSTQNGNATLLSIVNSDEVNGKAVKLRFRGALNADAVYDLQVFLSPGDMWTANISRNAEGVSILTTEDASCTKPAKATLNVLPFTFGRIAPYATQVVRSAGTREGYVEMITMADIPPSTKGVFPLIQQNQNGQAACGDATDNAAWTALDSDQANAAAYASLGLTPPSTGMFANWTIMNVPDALSWSGAAMAFEVTKSGVPAKGHLAYFPQAPQPKRQLDGFSADPLFKGSSGAMLSALSDLPDLSTPYYLGAADPAR